MRKRKRNPYPFIPKHAWNWKLVMDVTSGRGIAPFRIGKRIVEYEEYKWGIPKPLKKHNSPYTADDVAAMLKLEDSQELYSWLEYYQDKKRQVTEEEHVQEQIEDYLDKVDWIERNLKLTKKHIEVMRERAIKALEEEAKKEKKDKQ